ncbi:MAG: hypothetical protein KGI69_00590 [Patescibacteria group bacterium]|nr:hypothetical protein [Patescibacteria group bacterium]
MNAYIVGMALGAAAMAALFRVGHQFRKALTRPCPTCGRLIFKAALHYLSVSAESHIPRRWWIYCDTVTIRLCAMRHINIKTDTRWISVWAWYWRKLFHPDHFIMTPYKADCLKAKDGYGRSMPPASRLKIRIKTLGIPGSDGFGQALKPVRHADSLSVSPRMAFFREQLRRREGTHRLGDHGDPR